MIGSKLGILCIAVVGGNVVIAVVAALLLIRNRGLFETLHNQHVGYISKYGRLGWITIRVTSYDNK